MATPTGTAPVWHIWNGSWNSEKSVRFNGVPIAVRGDRCICIGPPDTITGGSGIVRINGKPVVRIDDATAHGGRIVQAVPSIKAD